jgi:hypothetical protein
VEPFSDEGTNPKLGIFGSLMWDMGYEICVGTWLVASISHLRSHISHPHLKKGIATQTLPRSQDVVSHSEMKMVIIREEHCPMNLEVAEHLKKLARDYRDTRSALQARYRETTSAEDFLAELRQREAAATNRFRLLQQHLLTALNEEELEKILELSRAFDEIRIINQFTILALTQTSKESEP